MLVTAVFLAAYPIHLSVSATRGELRAVEHQIAEARARNRMIEGDIAVLANVRQLDRWNADYFGYVAPTAEQYLPGERALANLDRLRAPDDMPVRAPVLAAMTGPDRGSAAASPAIARRAGSATAALARAELTRADLARVSRVSLSQVAMRDLGRGPAPRRGDPAGGD